MRCTCIYIHTIHTHTHIYRCKIALLTPTSWDTLYAYKAHTRTHIARGGGRQLQLIVRLKVDRANEENAERGRVIWAKSEKAFEERLCHRGLSNKTGFSLLSTICDRSLHNGALGLPGAPSASASASTELSCNSEYVFMLDLLPVPFQQRRGTQQSDRCQAHSEDLHTYTLTFTHIYLPSLLGIWQVIQSGCQFTRVLFLYILEQLVFEFMNIWKCCAVNESEFHIPKVA